jgi:hypothetical protein
MKLFSFFRKKPDCKQQEVRLVVGATAKAHVEAEAAQAALLALVAHYESKGADEKWAASASRVMGYVVGTLDRMKEAA